MSIVGNLMEEKRRIGPSLSCRPVRHLDTHTLEDVRRAFRPFVSCPLQQSWQRKPSNAFAPASVWVAWCDHELFVYAELVDADVCTEASGPNQRLWELGDAFEIFLGENGDDAYVELQVSPNNQRLQLRYESQKALEYARRHNDLNAALTPREAFRSKVWIGSGEWHVFAAIPAALVCGGRTPLPGSCWRYSFSRYDYTSGNGEPVISSSSPHARADFHRKHEWGHLYFKAA